MALVLTEEQTLLQDSARDFVANRWELDWLRTARDATTGSGHDEALWQQMVELGWSAIPFDEANGGLGLGYAELGVVLEELGRDLVVAPFLSTVVLAGSALQLAATPEQQHKLVPGICDGSKILAFAYQETPRHQPYAVTTSASADGTGFRLNGSKVLVLDGARADHLVVLVRTSGSSGERAGLTLCLVDGNAEGVNRQRDILLDSRSAAHIRFENVQISEADILGNIGEAADIVDEVLARGAIASSAEMLGGSAESFERTVEYLKEREQFGAKIGSFQGLKHRAARWFCEVELSRSVVLEALRAIDEADAKLQQIASVCKARSSDCFRLSGQEAVQMHGGMGVTDEADLGLFFKRSRVSELLLGDSGFHRNRYADLRGY
ncbi:MAG: acyl-CoA dehydrogenase family protein [Pseudomonadales bacterium]